MQSLRQEAPPGTNGPTPEDYEPAGTRSTQTRRLVRKTAQWEPCSAVVLLREPGDEDYGVLVPQLPGCHSQGRTAEEALAGAKEAIELHLQVLKEDGEDPPEEPTGLLVATVAVVEEAAIGR
jgi:predicted RNase H-like HicB family nuclease